jgi:hypothetical protein
MSKLVEALAVTAELTGTRLSDAAAEVMASDLARFPLPQVLEALTRCRRELKGRLTIAEVVSRIDDGRPGAEEAWAMLPKSEGASVVWTEEMATAFGVAAPLMDSDEIAARMAFKESYGKAVNEARNAGKATKWTPSLGQDAWGRESVLMEAVSRGRLTAEHAARMLPQLKHSDAFKALLSDASDRLRLGLRDERQIA